MVRVEINNRSFCLSWDEFCRCLEKGTLPAEIEVIDYPLAA